MRKKKKQENNNSQPKTINISNKELDRDIVNLYLEEPDLIMNSQEERVAYLKKLYGEDYLAEIDLS
jgi:hypothetical protein